MDQKILLESLTKQLDMLALLFSWMLGLTIPMAYARIKGQEEIEALGARITSRDAFYVAACISFAAQVAMLLSLTRLMTMVGLLNSENVVKGFTRLATHEWVLNPFGFFGSTLLARLQSAIAYGLFPIVWSIGGVLAVGMDAKRTTRANTLVASGFFLTGAAALSLVWGVNIIVLRRLHDVNLDLYRGLSSTFIEKNFCLLFVPFTLKAVSSALVKWGRQTRIIQRSGPPQ